MKQLFLFLSIMLITWVSTAQVAAVTSNGDEVILYSDGTWKYSKKNDTETKEISTSPIAFEKNNKSTFLVKSNKTNIGIYINAQKWAFKKTSGEEEAEYEFQLKNKDAYGMLIAERIEIPLESLKTIALENAKEAAPDMELIKQEYRNVNGQKVLCLQMTGTGQGIKFTYFGYYFSSVNGTVQLVAYTSQNLFKEYQSEIEELLNGFTVIK